MDRTGDGNKNGSTTPISFYDELRAARGDDQALADCVREIVEKLQRAQTTGSRPGMLLGKIQSGKTRAFVGAIAFAFDRGFTLAIVLTKGTKTLSAQTVARLRTDFAKPIKDDALTVYDIMKLPEKLTGSELRRKIVIVAKKQAQNLDRLLKFVGENVPLKSGKVLIVDDEADLASVRFVKAKGKDAIEQGKIAAKMDTLRNLAETVVFLQVTATPYSLYLQPEDYKPKDGSDGYEFLPRRPTFTELLPIHNGYVGGDDYFGDFASEDPRSHLYVEVPLAEQDALRRPDKRRIKEADVLRNPNTAGLRRAIVTFIVAVAVRRWQQENTGAGRRKYAMVIHNDTQRAAQSWQQQVVDWILDTMAEKARQAPAELRSAFNEAFNDLSASVTANGRKMPPQDIVFDKLTMFLSDDEIVRQKVNSDADVAALLDDNAELHLRTPLNIFIGGNILDRGITIPNLIAFYYGRNPRTMQADTVLQHSRMYGNRDREDLAVTRFYTSRAVYSRLYKINAFENALRQGFENGAHDNGVVFIQTDARDGIKPCAPNKILLSDVTAVRPLGMLLPTGFSTEGGTKMANIQRTLDVLIRQGWRDKDRFFDLELERALSIVDEIAKSMKFEGEVFDWDAFRALLIYYSSHEGGGPEQPLVYAITGRNLSREKSGDRTGLSILGTEDARRRVQDPTRKRPLLVLLQQAGKKEQGWSGYPFWWPILAAPASAKPCVFAAKTMA